MADPTKTGAYIPSSFLYDPGTINSMDANSLEFKDFIAQLFTTITQIIDVLNIKDSGFYVTQEFVNGQLFFKDPTLVPTSGETPVFRNVYRLVIDTGALTNAGVPKAVPHGLTPTNTWSFTRIYGAATNPVGLSFLPLPYASPTAVNNIELSVNALNVVITPGSNRTTYTKSYVVLEYIKV